MDSVKSPQRKPTEYNFCIRVTPKVLSKTVFESKGIENLYKLQIDKGSKKQTVETMKRNLHQQALEGFYRSQSCYFTLLNYTNFRPYEMKITFSEINSSNQEEIIFLYKFWTYGLVKNFIENDVQRSIHTVTKDFDTEFYIDFYIQSNKARLEEKVKRDDKKQILGRKHFRRNEQDDKNSDIFRKSVTSNNSPSKSSYRESSTINHRMQKNFYTRSSTPLFNTESAGKRRSFMDQNFDDVRSQKLSQNRSRKHVNQIQNIEIHERKFLKKYPSTKLYGDHVKQEEKDIIRENLIFGSVQKNIQKITQKLTDSDTIKYQRTVKERVENENKQKEFDLKVFLNMRDISLNEISYQIKKNIILIIFISIIFYIVASRAVDSINLNNNKIQKKHKQITPFDFSKRENSFISKGKLGNQRENKLQREKKIKVKKLKDQVSNDQKKKKKKKKMPSEVKRF